MSDWILKLTGSTVEAGSEVVGYGVETAGGIAWGYIALLAVLIVPRRNHVLGISRPSYKNRGPEFTQFATVIRSTRSDNTSLTVGLLSTHDQSRRAEPSGAMSVPEQ